MTTCPHFQHCEFVLTYIAKVKPHWDDFITHYCQGSFQDLCIRKKWFSEQRGIPPVDLMPTGQRVPAMLQKLEKIAPDAVKTP